MSNTTTPTQEDLRRALKDLISTLTPEDRLRLSKDKSFVKQLDESRRAAIHAYVESPEVLERRKQMRDIIANTAPPPAH